MGSFGPQELMADPSILWQSPRIHLSDTSPTYILSRGSQISLNSSAKKATKYKASATPFPKATSEIMVSDAVCFDMFWCVLYIYIVGWPRGYLYTSRNFHDLSWSFMIFLDRSWSFMIFHVISHIWRSWNETVLGDLKEKGQIKATPQRVTTPTQSISHRFGHVHLNMIQYVYV